MKYLIVEDNPITAKTLKKYLTSKEVEVVLAENSRQAQEIAQAQHIDKAFTDLDLPYQDGLQLARELKAHIETKDIPVYMYSSKPIDDDIINVAQRYGIVMCIPETLPDKIANFIKFGLL